MEYECAPVRRIYRGGRRHHADMSVVVLKTLSCRPRVLPGNKDYMKYQYHRYCRRADTDFVGTCTHALTGVVTINVIYRIHSYCFYIA
jgi:hypothetical protein